MFKWIKKLFRRNKNMNEITNKEIEVVIKEFLESKKLKDMQTADRYYQGDHDINKRVRKAVDGDGKEVVLRNLPNSKLVDNQFAKALDQKVNYIFAKEPTLTCKNEQFLENVKLIVNKEFLRTLMLIAKDSYKYGLSWAYIYPDIEGVLRIRKMDAKEIIPMWTDNEHKELNLLIRVYKTKVFETDKYVEKTKVEVYRPDKIEYFIWEDKLTVDKSPDNYLTDGENAYNWEKLPFICFKANELELPLINKVKNLQDALNTLMSDFQNNMEEDIRATLIVVKGYEGNKASEIRTGIANHGVISLGTDGGVEVLKIEINAGNYEVALKMLKKAIIENAKAFDAKTELLGSNPNQMNIQSMYSDIDLDANGIEREFQASFKELMRFIKWHLHNSQSVAENPDEEVHIIFNRDVMINESQAIDDCLKSSTLLSLETVLAQHPLVADVKLELERINKERGATEEYSNTFEEHKHGSDRDDIDE